MRRAPGDESSEALLKSARRRLAHSQVRCHLSVQQSLFDGAEVRTLSDELRALPIYPREVRARESFRNTASVSAQLDNFDHLNPDQSGG